MLSCNGSFRQLSSNKLNSNKKCVSMRCSDDVSSKLNQSMPLVLQSTTSCSFIVPSKLVPLLRTTATSTKSPNVLQRTPVCNFGRNDSNSRTNASRKIGSMQGDIDWKMAYTILILVVQIVTYFFLWKGFTHVKRTGLPNVLMNHKRITVVMNTNAVQSSIPLRRFVDFWDKLLIPRH